MAEAISNDNPDKKLQDIFIDAWNIYEELENTSLSFNSKEYQDKVREAMGYFERATLIVNQVGLFSPNELIDEVSTESLQYMLLPYFLGKLTTKIHDQQNIEVLELGEVYFKDHLQRCQEYELCEAPKALKKTDGDSSANGDGAEFKQLMQAAFDRNSKIAQYRKMKELDEYIDRLKIAVKNKSVDDEVKREFFLKFIDKSIIDAKQELQTLQDLKQMVKLRSMRIAGGENIHNEHLPPVIESASNGPSTHTGNHHHHGHSHGHSHGHYQQPGKPKPLQPFIITRDASQKAVFGMGYPSLPIMTVDEFYQQRVDEGIFPDEEKVAKMNQAQAIAAAQDPEEKEEQEKAEVDQQVDEDDPDYLDRMRRMDEYKDVVRRGDGNRHNRS